MAWLVSHIWMVLAGVALFSILLGWAVRGMFLVNKLHRAIGDREVAVAELNEAKSELDTLYKAQRGELPTKPHPAQTGNPDGVLRQELKDRERRLMELAEELAKSKSELEGLKSSKTSAPNLVGEASAAVAGAAAGAALTSKGEESPTLEWRNRHLEARVSELEAALESAKDAAENASTVAAPVATASAEAPAGVDQIAFEKAVWQADYFKQRAEALEEQVQAKATAAPPADSSVPDTPEADETEVSGRSEEINEELARLRWRNRYLEGRLSYFEGGAPPTGDASDAPELKDAAPAAAAIGAATAGVASAIASIGQEGEEEVVEDEAATELIDDQDDISSDEPIVEDDGEDVGAEDEAPLSEAILKSLSDADEAADEESAETQDDDVSLQDIDDELEAIGALDDSAEDGDDEFDVIELDDENQDEADDFEDDGEYDEAEDITPPLSPQATPLSPDQYKALSGVAQVVASEEVIEDDDEVEIDIVDEADEPTSVDAERVQPLALDGPVEGHPDDLTVIGGIGPKIQEVLNGLGIYHFDQIAAWTPENVAWVDDHLSFGGRIEREGWVSQAEVLAGEA